jgi:tetratricopeptide (TPR) repeat protein
MSITRATLIVTAVSLLAGAVVFGQTVQKKKPQPQATSSTATEQSRARRTIKPGDPTPASKSSETPSPASTETTTPPASLAGSANGSNSVSGEALPAEKPAEKAGETPAEATEPAAATVADPVLALRDEIDAASTPQERIRLQIKLADLLLAKGKKSEAVNELRSITSLEAFDPQGFYNTGNALARLGDTDEAVNAYKKAIDQRKGKYSRALNNLGVVLLRAGRWDESHDAFLAALKVEGFRYAEASYNLGRLYSARGQTDLAIREWRRALKIDPQHKAAAQFLAHARDEDSITVEPTPRETRPPRSSNARTTPAVMTAPPAPEKPAKASVPAIASKKPLSLDQMSFGFLQKARTASERGNTSEAIANYQRVISRQSGYFPPANLELSYLLIGLKRNDEALANLLVVTNRDGSRYPISYYHLGRLYENKGELKLAEAAYAQTVAAHRQNGQFLLDLSRIREKLGDLTGALEAMERFVVLMKKDGQELVWPEERVNELRQKIAARR